MQRSVGELIGRFYVGDDSAFDLLHESYNPLLVKFIQLKCGRPEEVDDITQETWIRVYYSLDKLAKGGISEDVFVSWLERQARLAANRVQRSKRTWTRMSDDGLKRAHSNLLSDLRAKECVAEMLSMVSDEDRVLITLRMVEELSYAELSRIYLATPESLEKRFESARERVLTAFEQNTFTRMRQIESEQELTEEIREEIADSYSSVVEVGTDFQRLINEIAAKSENLFHLTSRQFEELVAELFERFGYVVELTRRTRDGGRDVIAVKNAETEVRFLIECKKYAKLRKVGVDLVRKLYGVKTHERATKAILATTSSFTRDAQAFVDQHRWELEAKDHFGVVKWVKDAQRMVKRGDSGLWVPSWMEEEIVTPSQEFATSGLIHV